MTYPIPTFHIYDHPRDYPQHFVVRRGFITANGEVEMMDEPPHLLETLKQVKNLIPAGMTPFSAGMLAMADPDIIEIWLPRTDMPVVYGPRPSARTPPTVRRLSRDEAEKRLKEVEKLKPARTIDKGTYKPD